MISPDKTSLRRLKILYVEDNPTVREETSRFLKRRVDILWQAQDGQEGFELYERHQPHVIITDIRMPRRTGLEMAGLIRARDRRTPIIVMTAYNETEFLREAIDTGVDKFLIKPVDPRKLLEALALSSTIAEQERRIEIQNRELLEKNQEMERLLYIASHDLRSPLVSIQGFTGELRSSMRELRNLWPEDGQPPPPGFAEILKEDIAESLHFIGTAASRMDQLLTGLLRISRLGRSRTRIQTIEVNRLIDELADSFRFQFQQAGVRFSREDLPPCHADETLLGQAFSNLLDNALKYRSTKRPARIRVSGARDTDGMIRYAVEDNGIGIPGKETDRIFELFHRVDPAQGAGEGLGLAIVQRAALRLGGGVSVDSREGEGSRFTLRMPAERELEEKTA